MTDSVKRAGRVLKDEGEFVRALVSHVSDLAEQQTAGLRGSGGAGSGMELTIPVTVRFKNDPGDQLGGVNSQRRPAVCCICFDGNVVICYGECCG